MIELSCPKARSMVSDYIDGELPVDLAQALEQHLQTCRSCPPLYASLVDTLAQLKALDDATGVDSLVRRVVQALDAERPSGSDRV